MKTKQITIRLTVPDWLPGPAYWNNVKTTWKTLKYKLNPCKCIDCGAIMDYRNPEYCWDGDATHKRVILSCSTNKITDDPNRGVCGKCLAKRIRSVFALARPTRSRYGNGLGKKTATIKHECDSCGKVKPTLDVCHDPQCDIRFGSGWWNGHHICEECLCIAAEQGKTTSGRVMWRPGGGGSIYINHKGAAIGLTRWYDLLIPPKKEKKNDEN